MPCFIYEEYFYRSRELLARPKPLSTCADLRLTAAKQSFKNLAIVVGLDNKVVLAPIALVWFSSGDSPRIVLMSLIGFELYLNLE